MSQRSTGLGDHERGSAAATGSTAATDFPLDYVHVWRDWCRMVGLSPVTAWREVKAGPALSSPSSRPGLPESATAIIWRGLRPANSTITKPHDEKPAVGAGFVVFGQSIRGQSMSDLERDTLAFNALMAVRP